MRVQFSVNDMEWSKLQKVAKSEGYPDVPSYCKDTALGDRTYGKLWQTIVEKISKKEKGETFALRDLVDTPPANLGVKLYNHQEELGISVLNKDSLGSNLFIKQ